jgi:hypothetical protein
MGEMPRRGSPDTHVWPKSLLEETVVVVLNPSWFGRIAVAFNVS